MGEEGNRRNCFGCLKKRELIAATAVRKENTGGWKIIEKERKQKESKKERKKERKKEKK